MLWWIVEIICVRTWNIPPPSPFTPLTKEEKGEQEKIKCSIFHACKIISWSYQWWLYWLSIDYFVWIVQSTYMYYLMNPRSSLLRNIVITPVFIDSEAQRLLTWDQTWVSQIPKPVCSTIHFSTSLTMFICSLIMSAMDFVVCLFFCFCFCFYQYLDIDQEDYCFKNYRPA